MGSHSHAGIVPALGIHALTPLYDFVIRLSMRERVFRDRVIDAAEIASGMRVLDVGCGTATLLLRLHERVPAATLVGIDADPAILEIARRKAQRVGAPIELDTATASALLCADASFDRVLTTLALHHLTPDEKRAALGEIRRVLRPGGRLVIGDFGAQGHGPLRGLFGIVRRVDGVDRTRLHLAGEMPELVRGAGFENVRRAGEIHTLFGTIELLVAAR